MHCESKTEKEKETKLLKKFCLDFVSDSPRLQMILNWLKCLRDILPLDDYKVASMEGNKKNFKAVIECKHRRFTGCDQSVYDTIQPEDKWNSSKAHT